MNTKVILVDEQDNPIGDAEKLIAHQTGILHRAFSVFVFYESTILLQKRHSDKYHSGGLWTNTCCSHPAPREEIKSACVRRLKEELGFEISLDALQEVGVFHYTANVGENLIENEIDHVIIYPLAEPLDIDHIAYNPTEISELKWVKIKDLLQDLDNHPAKYTAWLKEALEIVVNSGKII